MNNLRVEVFHGKWNFNAVTEGLNSGHMLGDMQQLIEQMNLAKQVQGSAKRKVSSTVSCFPERRAGQYFPKNYVI